MARVLQRLAEHGLANVQEAGAGVALLYTLNREHLAAEPLINLLNLRRCLVTRLEAEFERWTVLPAHASLFGSFARRDGDTSSDIDLLLVRPLEAGEENENWRSQLDEIAGHIFDWTGNRAGIAEVGAEELERLRRERPPIVEEFERDSITLYGPHVRELLGRA